MLATIATLPLAFRDIGAFKTPDGYAVLDLETHRIKGKWEVPPATLIGIGYGYSYVRVRVEGERGLPTPS